MEWKGHEETEGKESKKRSMEGGGFERRNNWNGIKGKGTAKGMEGTERKGRKVESRE